MAKVCVFGSANMDLVVEADRAPERGETVAGRRFTTVPGGKGANQAIAAARAGAEVTMVGAVGDDANGAALLDVLGRSGVDTAGVARVDEATGTAHITVEADGDNRIVVVPGANGTLRAAPSSLTTGLEGADVLLLQLEVPIEAVVAAARAARAAGVRVVLTPAPVRPLPEELLACVDLLVPNQHEAERLTGNELESVTGLVPEAVVTMGSEGARRLRRGADPVHVDAYDVRALDTTGAGDTFVGALAVALAEGRDMPDAMGWAAAAAAIAVQRFGASSSMPTRAEIDALVATGR